MRGVRLTLGGTPGSVKVVESEPHQTMWAKDSATGQSFWVGARYSARRPNGYDWPFYSVSR
jgi:hypothetical protein